MAGISPSPRLRLSARTPSRWKTEEARGKTARLSRSPSLASAGSVRSLWWRLPAFENGGPLRDGGSRAEVLALSKSPTWGTHVSALAGPLGPCLSVSSGFPTLRKALMKRNSVLPTYGRLRFHR